MIYIHDPAVSKDFLYVRAQSLSYVRLFVTAWTVAHQPPLSMEFSRQEYWSWLPLPTPGDLVEPVIEPVSSGSPALVAGFLTTEPPGKPIKRFYSL